jgi:hypothetical protein
MRPAPPPRRRVLTGGVLLLAGSLLGGCFRPMLAADSPATELMGRVRLPAFDDRFGYYLDQTLRDRLGSSEAAPYRLEIKTRLKQGDLAITQDNAVTRISLTATADWALYPTEGDEPVLKDRTVSQSGYSSTASLFATRAVKRDIERRLARDLGERIARSILARADVVRAGS